MPYGFNDNKTKYELPTKLSQFTNDSGFITKAVSDLTNYYTKTQILALSNLTNYYTKTYLDIKFNTVKKALTISGFALHTTATSGVSWANSVFAKKTGNVVFLNISSVHNNSASTGEWQNWSAIVTAFNSMAAAWRKGLPRVFNIHGCFAGTEPATLYCKIEQTNYTMETCYVGRSVAANTEWDFNCSWVVDD